ncbi:hypothetical protein PFISCL1PPCAC_7163, partial [Pristionchus fissidentatus]
NLIAVNPAVHRVAMTMPASVVASSDWAAAPVHGYGTYSAIQQPHHHLNGVLQIQHLQQHHPATTIDMPGRVPRRGPFDRNSFWIAVIIAFFVISLIPLMLILW